MGNKIIYSDKDARKILDGLLITIFFLLILVISVAPSSAKSVQNMHINITGNITDPECSGCHLNTPQDFSSFEYVMPAKKGLSGSMEDLNYISILSIGQTPYQLGPFFNGGSVALTGWSWWDVEDFGSDKQKNLISLMIFDKNTGKPVTGLSSYPSFPQASYRKHGGTYSYKADTAPAPISTQINYPDLIDIWMIRSVDLSGYQDANLTFWTWYSMETDWDYGYVAVSTDGNNWNHLSGTLTTNNNPNGNNLGNGITGNSGGSWVQETMNLTPYTGNKILIGFRFKSDDYTNEEGWYIDDINVASGTTVIYNDDAETALSLSVNVTYPYLSLLNKTDPLTYAAILNYLNHTKKIDLFEDASHPGTYVGYFKYDPFAEQYSGNYSVVFDTMINGSRAFAEKNFQTTLFGCQNCHNKKLSGVETSYVHGEGGGMKSCTYICHGGSRGFYGGAPPFMGPPLPANPMHVHEMQYGHMGGFLDSAWYPQPPYNVSSHVNAASCVQCHTSFIHDNAGTDTQNIANYTLYGTNISFSSGKHENLTCEFCHGTLAYPSIPSDQHQLNGSLGKYKPSFTSHESFADTYIVSVDGTDNISITVNGIPPSSESIEIYAIGPVDNTSTVLQAPCSGHPCNVIQNLSSPVNLNIPNHSNGIWIAKVIQQEDGVIDYTISSNYAIERKPIIKIPECNTCHNTNGSGKAYTSDSIPDWNPGFAHADTNNDGELDVQCQMCHDAMHQITVKNCQNCHASAPAGHPVTEPLFSQYSISQCLDCHGTPHEITGATNCIACHSPGDVNISLFGRHSKMNTSDGEGNVTNYDCWTCHFEKDMNKSNVYLCEACHLNSTGIVQVNDTSLIKSDFIHGMTTCRTCHASSGYHQQGTVGPLGLAEKIMKKALP